jgi:hypothetical protein
MPSIVRLARRRRKNRARNPAWKSRHAYAAREPGVLAVSQEQDRADVYALLAALLLGPD